VSQTVSVSLTGAVVVQEAAQQAGRPITLTAAGGGEHCWLTKADLDALYALTEDAGRTMTLELAPGDTRQVMWRRDQQPISARPVLEVTDPDDGTLYVLAALRLMEV
ncbi:hypothetical protein, partial [Desulfacinum hydrothermale]|uniref:hypothetical protein n=1 Tax=Desulfacinum hydrothermale TaxID=109258 RepID=UPI00148293C5